VAACLCAPPPHPATAAQTITAAVVSLLRTARA
jgi:hypothetical protein